MNMSGVVLSTDDTGFIVRKASTTLIQSEWWPPVERIVDAYKECFGPVLRSIYVRGSVPVGRAIYGLSDIDTFALLEHDHSYVDADWARALSGEVIREWPFVAYVEAQVLPLSTLHTSRWLTSTIKTQSACVYGTDFSRDIPGFKPGIELMFESWEFLRSLAVAGRIGTTLNDREKIQRVYFWAIKRLIRSAFELVMERASCFTRDLYPCCQIFGRYYPEQAVSVSDALKFAIDSNPNHTSFDRITGQIGDWLYEEICTTYGAQRISQLLDLPASSR